MTPPVLSVRNLRIHYATPSGDVPAVDGVSFDLNPRETLGLVGESGSGKTTAVSGILRTVSPPGRIVDGTVELDGIDLLSLGDEDMRRQRWETLALIPQGAMNSLNPTMRIRDQIADVIETHRGRQDRKSLRARILDLLAMVGLPARTADLYPHELSGGMKQRACIAMAVALDPKVLIADEATSALDVVVQRVVAQTMARVRDALGVSMIMIGHDAALMAQMADRIAVMFAGRIVEVAPVAAFFEAPAHPYSRQLMDAVPSLDGRKPRSVPTAARHETRIPESGCAFRFRCPHAIDACRAEPPELRALGSGRQAACIRADSLPEEADA